MRFGESSFLGHRTTTEPSFTARATGRYEFPVHRSGSSFMATSGSVSRATGYSNFPLQHKLVSTSTVRAPGKSSGTVMAFHSSAQWREHFDASKNTEKLMVIDFTATWCGPCRSMDAVINGFAAKYTNVEFIKIDVDELHDVAMKYQVMTMPTFLLIKKGNVVDKVVGADKDRLKAKIEHRLR